MTYLVAYADDEGFYAAAFSSRALAEGFVRNVLGGSDEATIVETTIDANADLAKETTP